MSLDSWKKEFYSVAADKVSVEEALEHSLRKWTGLLPMNLARHGVWLEEDAASSSVSDGRKTCSVSDGRKTLRIDSHSCALCFHHTNEECRGCPLKEARGQRCDVRMREELRSPWKIWVMEHNPDPMIFWLSEAKARTEPLSDKEIWPGNFKGCEAVDAVNHIN